MEETGGIDIYYNVGKKFHDSPCSKILRKEGIKPPRFGGSMLINCLGKGESFAIKILREEEKKGGLLGEVAIADEMEGG